MEAASRMALHVDDAAERTLTRIINGLRTARLGAGISQNALAAGLPVRARAISEWENGQVAPKLDHLFLAADELNHHLVLIGRDGCPVSCPTRAHPGEEWVIFQRRRLATPLRHRRLARGWTQRDLGRLVGVSRDSIQRWELVRVPPGTIAQVMWVQMLGYELAVEPVLKAPTGVGDVGMR